MNCHVQVHLIPIEPNNNTCKKKQQPPYGEQEKNAINKTNHPMTSNKKSRYLLKKKEVIKPKGTS